MPVNAPRRCCQETAARTLAEYQHEASASLTRVQKPPAASRASRRDRRTGEQSQRGSPCPTIRPPLPPQSNKCPEGMIKRDIVYSYPFAVSRRQTLEQFFLQVDWCEKSACLSSASRKTAIAPIEHMCLHCTIQRLCYQKYARRVWRNYGECVTKSFTIDTYKEARDHILQR